jgi:hypothetical protein
MAKRKQTRAKAKVPAKANGGSIPTAPEPEKYHVLAAMHCLTTAPYRYARDDKVRDKSAEGAINLYLGLHPQNALESVLGSLIVNVASATNDCLSHAARVGPTEDRLQHRDVNLRHALKGAAVVTQLVDAFERVRGNRPGNVSIGQVNVESGGQAIVGKVQSGQSGRRDEEPEESR